MPVIRSFSVADGMVGTERMPNDPDELYATPEELGALYGCKISEATIRFCMSLIHAYTNRPSLWPIEIESPITRLPSDRYETRLPVTPVIRILQAGGRYAYGMRRDRQGWNALHYGYAAMLALQGVVPQMVNVNPDLVLCDASTGILTFPSGFSLYPFAECKFRYLAGFVEIPPRVKAALAELANSIQSRGVSDRIGYNVGRISRKYAPGSNTFISPQAEMLLAPFVVTAMY